MCTDELSEADWRLFGNNRVLTKSVRGRPRRGSDWQGLSGISSRSVK